MQKDKEKTGTLGKLVVGMGGLVIGLPVAIGLGSVLLLLSLWMTLFIVFGATESGLTPILTTIAAVCVAMLFILVRATLKYSGGIRALFQRLRGIQEEQARIERLMQKQDSEISDDTILVDAQDNDNIKKHSQH